MPAGPAAVTTAPPLADVTTLDELLHRLGNIPPSRVRLRPYPGTATEADVLAIDRAEKRRCELVDGVLVEKARGFRESVLALALAQRLRAFVVPRNLGVVSGEAGMMRLFPGLVRIPDVAFLSWDRLPERRMPTEPIPSIVPDLAVEILSVGNTAEEMARKRRDYFAAGVRLVWLVDLPTRTVQVFTAPEGEARHAESDTLDGGAALPGFSLPLAELFGELDRQAKA